jgi:LCP family protein required for cell wall assembly
MAETGGVHARPASAFAESGDRTFGAALGWTVLGALIPGLGYVVAGRPKLGSFVLVVLALLLAFGIGALIWAKSMTLLIAEIASRPNVLISIGIGAVALALLWIIVILTSHRMLLPDRAPVWQQSVGGLVAVALCAAVALPSGIASRDSFATYDVITSVFADANDPAPAPGVTHVPIDRADPWKDRPRLNLLLLGGDSGPDREGMRTDTMIEASIDTHTGDTVLFSLPRNLQYAPIPEDNPLHDLWPDGYKCGSGSSACLLNGIYREAEDNYPSLFPGDPNPGMTTLRGVVGEITGLPVDYYLLVNLEGFERFVNALGGITIDVGPNRVPIGGLDINGNPQPDWKIEEWIPSGIQHLNGYQALWFSRDRRDSDDYDRMRRQRCVINAIVEQASPSNVLANYMELASTVEDVIDTDVPYQLFPALVELGDKVKEHPIRSLPFTDDVITTAHPDFDLIRELVQQALDPAPPTTTPPGTTPPSETPSGSPTESPSSSTPDPTVAVPADEVCG